MNHAQDPAFCVSSKVSEPLVSKNVDFHEKYFLAQFEEVCIFQNKIYNF